MALVGVIAKELTPEDLEGASRGQIPADLGGGRFGAKGVPRGFPDIGIGIGQSGQGSTPPSKKYFDRMKGGADVPAHAMNRENTGQSTIAHPASLREVKEQGMGGDDEGRDIATERMHRLLAEMERGGRGLAGAMRRQGVNSREFYPGNPGIHAGTKYGVKTAEIPGSVEAAPHERRHAAMGGGEVDDVLDGLASAHEKREGEPNNPFKPNQKTTTQSDTQLSAGARTPNQEQREDKPEGTGSRRQEN